MNLFAFKKKAILFSYHHPAIFKRITTFRSSFLDLKKHLK